MKDLNPSAVYCSICRRPLPLDAPESLREHASFKLGQLNDIALAHRTCAEADNLETPGYWK